MWKVVKTQLLSTEQSVFAAKAISLVQLIIYSMKGCLLPGAFSLVQAETLEPIALPLFPDMLPWKQGEK